MPRTQDPKGRNAASGAVQEAIRHLLTKTRVPYPEIATRVRTKCGSRTSASSVRSQAAELRRAKIRVLKRPRGTEH